MSNPFDSLTDDQVRKITLLLEAFDKSTFDFLQLQVGELKLTLGAGDPPPSDPGKTLIEPPSRAPRVQPAPAITSTALGQSAPSSSQVSVPKKNVSDDGTVAIIAPIIGRFYDKPQPGAAPFVKVGSVVSTDTTVCLIEVMKLFQAVRAGVSGVIAEISVEDAQMVENGQTLFRVRPGHDSKSAART